ncbi:hypothetical protein DFH06DRAFT_100050 [Mycena polygramma]|nr:hypothetical protein DFH06DRAFT_100050 [Mycena polygramma]
MRSFWFLLVPVLLVAAGQTNHTLDDANTQVEYLPSGSVGMSCDGCSDADNLKIWALDASKLQSGTFSAFPPPGDNIGDTGMQFSFTGTGVYIFLALSPYQPVTESPTAALQFFLDDVLVGTNNSLPTTAPSQYNISVYANNSIPNAFHTFRMGITGQVLFDYAVYTSDDDDPTSPSQTSTSTSTSSSPAAPRMSSSSTAQKKPPVATIAGAAVGAVASIAILLLGLIIVRRARRNNGRGPDTPAMEESGPASTDAFFTATTRGPEPLSAEQFRILQQQVQRLEQRVEGSVSAGSETTSLGRSLSTMKREQTRALQEHGQGMHITDTLVHTDSGLRLTAGRGADEGVVDELPPTYVAD